jgi:hypothetical protein
VCFGEQRQEVIGKKFQEVYFSQFLAKLGARRAQLGFLDILEPLKPSIFHYEHCKSMILIL